MTATATRSPGLPTDYYAPEFVVEVEGTPLDPASKGDVLEIKVEMDLKELTSVDLKINNYDDTAFDLKWSERAEFAIGNRVHVQMGYADRLCSMIRGYITAMSAEFPSDGPPTLVVRALDGLVKLKGSKPPEGELTYENLADWQIAQRIAQRHGLRVKATETGPVHDLVVQRNVDDALFVKERAALIDFDAYVHIDPTSGEDVLWFVEPADGRGTAPVTTYVLSWGSLRNGTVPPSMIEFKPTITAGDQVQSVTVRGWDPVKKQKISQTATGPTTPGVTASATGSTSDTRSGAASGPSTGPDAAAALGGSDGRHEVIVDRPVATDEEALALARSLLADRSYEFLTAHGKIIGLPDLRPGDTLEIDGVGARFGGSYFTTKVTHTLSDKGYLTEFDLRK